MYRFFILLFSVSAISAPAQVSTWPLFSPKNGRFEIRIPAEPKGIENRFPLPKGEVMAGWNYIHEDSRSKIAFTVGYNDWPEHWLKERPASWFLDSGREGMIKTLGGKLTRETIIEKDGHPGREVVGEIPGLGIIFGRIFLVGNRYYQISAIYKPEHSNYGITDAYLNSFQIRKE